MPRTATPLDDDRHVLSNDRKRYRNTELETLAPVVYGPKYAACGLWLILGLGGTVQVWTRALKRARSSPANTATI